MDRPPQTPRTTVICPSCGPYHVARFSALRVLNPEGLQILEVAAQQRTYPWQADTSALPIETLFDEPYEQLNRAVVARRLQSRMATFNPQVVIVNGYSEAEMRRAAVWARRRGSMVLTFFESCLHDRPRHPVKELAKRYFVSRTLQGAFVGGTLHREYAIRLGIPPHAIETGYDAVANAHFAAVADSARQDAQALRRQFGLPGAYFLYVGRFAPEKNVAGLLRAYALYRKRHRLDPWPLVLVGSGPQEAHLRSLAAELGLTDVYWPGFRPIDELPMFYALATCFVLPSTSEPWGLVVNEALATGLPVLVSDRCGCAPELVQEGRNGFCFAPEDVPRLAQLMVSMACADQPTRVAFGEMSRRIVEPYSTEEWARRLTRLVRNLLSEGSHRK